MDAEPSPPVEKKTQVPLQPLVAPIPSGESARYVPSSGSLCKALFLLLSAAWALGIQSAICATNQDPRRRGHRVLLSFLPRSSSAPRRPPLASHRLRWQSLFLGAHQPTLNTRRIQSVILSSTLTPNGNINTTIITTALVLLTRRQALTIASSHTTTSVVLKHRNITAWRPNLDPTEAGVHFTAHLHDTTFASLTLVWKQILSPTRCICPPFSPLSSCR